MGNKNHIVVRSNKKIGGKLFSKIAGSSNKQTALAEARSWRNKGFYARVIKCEVPKSVRSNPENRTHPYYAVYARRH